MVTITMHDENEDDSLTDRRRGVLAMAKLAEQHAKILEGDYYLPKSDDEILREKHPTLKDAWDKYQSILTLCKIDEVK